jgi:hypothetical protein
MSPVSGVVNLQINGLGGVMDFVHLIRVYGAPLMTRRGSLSNTVRLCTCRVQGLQGKGREGMHLEFHHAISHSNFAASVRVPGEVLGGALAAARGVPQHSQSSGMWGLC